jgi:hypothetical protein
MFFSHTWTARPFRWRHNYLSKCQKLLAQQHSITSNMTWMCSNTAVTMLNLAPTQFVLVKSDNHAMPSTATSAAFPTTHGTSFLQWPQHKTWHNFHELTSVLLPLSTIQKCSNTPQTALSALHYLKNYLLPFEQCIWPQHTSVFSPQSLLSNLFNTWCTPLKCLQSTLQIMRIQSKQ